ncbi:MAG: GNAT family protein [Gemmatimonadaceae bacterium]
MELSLERCVIRSWRLTDAPDLAREADDRTIWINVRDRMPSPYTLAHAVAYVSSASAADPECNFAITVDGRVAGSIGLTYGTDIYRLTAEVGYWLGAEWRGRGIASDALSSLAEWVFATTPIVRLHASVFIWNPASARVLEKARFRLESTARKAAIKNGEIVDEWVYVRLRDD